MLADIRSIFIEGFYSNIYALIVRHLLSYVTYHEQTVRKNIPTLNCILMKGVPIIEDAFLMLISFWTCIQCKTDVSIFP